MKQISYERCLNKLLYDRATMLGEARTFFAKRKILEVDCPVLSPYASVDLHIDLISAQISEEEVGYLHSSPEYAMKRLLADDCGDIYQLSHVFRAGENGPKHCPEFMMAEWYRLGFSFEEMIEETIEFIHLFIGELPYEVMTYQDLSLKYASIDPFFASSKTLKDFLKQQKIEVDGDLDKDSLLGLVLETVIEPQMKERQLYVVTNFPHTQAALARIDKDKNGTKVAKRFEIFFQGTELANGYDELTDPIEQQQRLEQANQQRQQHGKNPLPIDQNFLAALKKGLLPCCGVAVGFDRLMMLRHQKDHIKDVLPFSSPSTTSSTNG